MDLPSDTGTPGAVKGRWARPASRLVDEWDMVGVVLRTQPEQRWVPAVVQLWGRDEEEMAQRGGGPGSIEQERGCSAPETARGLLGPYSVGLGGVMSPAG